MAKIFKQMGFPVKKDLIFLSFAEGMGDFMGGKTSFEILYLDFYTKSIMQR